jgi:hypothetical protein
MKQVGFRQEAARLGGIGSCGRELCCSTWLTDFRSVNTSAARYQQLSLNPQKLAGQCGKLKCCLNYELDTYMDALKNFPEFETRLVTEKGDAICQKQDIFKGLMWFAYTNNFANWHVLKIEQVREIIAENKLKNKVSSLEDFAIDEAPIAEKDFNNAMGQESLTRFDQPKKKKRPTKKKKPGENAIVANKPAGSNVIRPNNPNHPAVAKVVEKPANQNPNQNPNQNANATTERKPNNRNKNRNKPSGNRKPAERNPNEPKPDNRIIPNKKNESKE